MGLNMVLGGLSGVAGIVNGLGANARLKAAQEARERMLSQIGSDLQQHYQQVQEGNLQSLRRSSGMLGDNLVAQGRDMGSALARAGVSNSSATAGALVKGEANNAAALQGQSQQNYNTEQSLMSQDQDKLNNLRLGNDNFGRPTGVGLNADILNAEGGAGAAWQGVANLGSSLSGLFQPKTSGGAIGSDTPVFGSGAQAAIDAGTVRPNLGPLNVGGIPTNTTNPMGLNLSTGGARLTDPIQSDVQTRAAQVGAGVGSPSRAMFPNVSGPVMNGNNNGAGLNYSPNMQRTIAGYRRLF